MIQFIKNALRWIRVVSAALESGVKEYEKDGKQEESKPETKE